MKAPHQSREPTREELGRLSALGRMAMESAFGGMQRHALSILKRVQPFLKETNGIPVAVLLRYAAEQYELTGKILWAHVARTVSAEADVNEPPWVTDALLKQSKILARKVLKFGPPNRTERSTTEYRKVRDLRIYQEVKRLLKEKGISKSKAYGEAAKSLGLAAITVKRTYAHWDRR